MVRDTDEVVRERAAKRDRASSTTTERPSGSKRLRHNSSEVDEEEAPAQGTGKGRGKARGGTRAAPAKPTTKK